jgi:hypothetical protein
MSKHAFYIVEAAFGSTPFVEPAWTRLDTDNGVRSLSKRHGRKARYEPLPPADLTLVLDNKNGRLDSANTASPYFPNVKRDVQLRVRLDTTLTDDPVNLLSLDQAHFQGPAVVGWENNGNAALAINPDQQAGPGDERNLKVTSTAGTTTSPVVAGIRTVGTGASSIPLPAGAGGQRVTFQWKQLSAARTQNPILRVEWFDAAGTLIATGSSGTLSVTRTDRWETRFSTRLAPAGAAFVRVYLDVAPSAITNEVQHVGRVSVALGEFAPWTIPGGIYPIFRGHVLDWIADYDTGLNDAFVTITATDISRIFAEHKLWPTLAEHDLLDGFCGPPPVHYYVLDEGQNAPIFRDRKRDDITNFRTARGDEVGAGETRLRNDHRRFAKFAGSGQETVSRATIPGGAAVIEGSLGDNWAVEAIFNSEKASADQTIIHFPGTARLFVIVNRVEWDVAMTDGTTQQVAGGVIVSGRTHVATATCDANGAIRLYVDGVFVGAAGTDAIRTPKAPTGDASIGVRGDSSNNQFSGDIGRVAFYNAVFSAPVHAKPYFDALAAPWGFTTNVGWRMRFLLEEFRHRRNNDGTDVAGTYPGLPASWMMIDDPSDRAPLDMLPRGRSLLDYMRSLEATESGLLKIKNTGVVRFRRRALKVAPRKPGAHFAVETAGATPYRDVHIGTNSDIVTVVNYSITGQDVESELRSKAGVAAHGESSYSLPSLEAPNDDQARAAAQDILNVNAISPPADTAEVILNANDPRVGHAAVCFEPGDQAFLVANLPQYGHSKPYEVLEVNLDHRPGSPTVVTLKMVGS